MRGDLPAPVCVRVVGVGASARESCGGSRAPCARWRSGEVTRLTVRLLALRQAARWESVSGRATLLVEGLLPRVLRGDVLEVAGTLARVRSPANPGEPDMAALRRQSRELVALYAGHPACVQVAAAGRGNAVICVNWAGFACGPKACSIGGSAPPQSALAAALLLGSRERLDRSIVQAFFVTGTIHLLSISGMHVSILASVHVGCDATRVVPASLDAAAHLRAGRRLRDC